MKKLLLSLLALTFLSVPAFATGDDFDIWATSIPTNPYVGGGMTVQIWMSESNRVADTIEIFAKWNGGLVTTFLLNGGSFSDLTYWECVDSIDSDWSAVTDTSGTVTTVINANEPDCCLINGAGSYPNGFPSRRLALMMFNCVAPGTFNLSLGGPFLCDDVKHEGEIEYHDFSVAIGDTSGGDRSPLLVEESTWGDIKAQWQ